MWKLSRRSIIKASASLAVFSKINNANAYGGLARSDGNYLVKNGAIAVPSDYAGMHFGGWPIINPSWIASTGRVYPTGNVPTPAPTNMLFGSNRSCANGFDCWYLIETSQGVYDFSNMDTIVSTMKARGCKFIFTLWWVPTFYMQAGNPVLSSAHPNAGYPDSVSPNGLTALSNFITALITRYNTAGGAWASQANGGGTNWSVYGKGIDILEPMNEPNYSIPGAFWQDSAAKLVDFCYTAKTAAKAVDPAIVFWSPGFGSVASMNTFLTASGVINTGVTGASLPEEMSIHLYSTAPACQRMGSWGVTAQLAVWDLLSAWKSWRGAMASNGVGSLPVNMGEGGFDGATSSAELTLATNQTSQWRYQWLGRMMLVGAALGFKKWMNFAWDDPFLCFPMNDPDGVAKAVNDVHVNVAGKTIKNAYYDVGGAVTLQFTDGSSFAI